MNTIHKTRIAIALAAAALELIVSVRLAAISWQEVVIAVPARDEAIETGSNEHR
jgi:hypothetical protein